MIPELNYLPDDSRFKNDTVACRNCAHCFLIQWSFYECRVNLPDPLYPLVKGAEHCKQFAQKEAQQ